ncbi:radical SAM protein [Synechococcus sp. W4D4]|uniref:radical SAM protein n=1 Tax=Synechococcus sp. W4D4 TaxID=3392294 RepID=UPI0039E9293D
MIYEGFELDSLYEYNTSLLIERIKSNNLSIHLYGCGIQARTAIAIFLKLNLETNIRVYDSNIAKIGSDFCGFTVESTTYFAEAPNSIVILTCCFPEQVLRALEARHSIYSLLPLYDAYKHMLSLEDLNSDGLNYSRSLADMAREMQLYQNELLSVRSKLASDSLNLKSIDAVVTEGCSLKCIDCSNLMQYYQKPKSADIDTLIDASRRVLEAVDYVYEWRILGGEPLIFKNLPKYLNFLSSFSNIKSILIFTNGTILPNESCLEAIKTSGSVLDISNYNTHSRRINELIHLCEENDILYSVKDPIWSDSGRIHKHKGESLDQLQEKFFNCCTKDVLTLLHGKLYHCPFSANLINLDSTYFNAGDVLSVDASSSNLRSEISSFYTSKTYLNACNYCNGRDYTVPLIPTAVQTRKPLPLP